MPRRWPVWQICVHSLIAGRRKKVYSVNTKEKTASKVNESEWEGKYKQRGDKRRDEGNRKDH